MPIENRDDDVEVGAEVKGGMELDWKHICAGSQNTVFVAAYHTCFTITALPGGQCCMVQYSLNSMLPYIILTVLWWHCIEYTCRCTL